MSEDDGGDLLQLLRSFAPHPFHCTSRDGLAAILRRGAILPNTGTMPTTFGGPYYGMRRGYVCLFDFATPTLAQCQSEARQAKWDGFFRHHQPVTVSILLDPSLRIIPNAHAVAEVGYGEKFFPFVEAWHAGPIPRDSIAGYAVMCGARPTACRRVPAIEDPLRVIDDIANEFTSTYADAYAWNPMDALLENLPPKQRAALLARDRGTFDDEDGDN